MLFRPAQNADRAPASIRRPLGLPRALFHFLHPGLWETFFSSLGIPVVQSSPTVRTTLERADLISETEHCLPVKILDAHLDELASQVDRVFIPRILSQRRGFISCPKLAALPDAVRAQFRGRFDVVTADLDENRRPLARTLADLGRQMGFGTAETKRAATAALKALASSSAIRCTDPPLLGEKNSHTLKHELQTDPARSPASRLDFHLESPVRSALEALYAAEAFASAVSPSDGPRQFLLIGHPYNLEDAYLSDPVRFKMASMGIPIERLPFGGPQGAPDPLRWDTSAHMLEYLRTLSPARCAGVIQLTSFNCGCDSMAGPYYRETLQAAGIPFMALTLDSHSALAGLDTRLEAFVDSIAGRS